LPSAAGQAKTIESVIMTARTPINAKAIIPAGAHGQLAETAAEPVGERLRNLVGISPNTSDIGQPPFPGRCPHHTWCGRRMLYG
jgi:hypothetical protein